MINIIWIITCILLSSSSVYLVNELLDEDKRVTPWPLLVFGLSLILIIVLQPYIK